MSESQTNTLGRTMNDDNQNTHIPFDTWVKNRWKVGSTVEIYSNSANVWFSGDIVRIFKDLDAEWLEVQYSINNTSQLKQIRRAHRDDKNSIRPYSKAIKIYQYIYKALQIDSKFNTVMNDTVKNVNIVAENQNNILEELQQLNTEINKLENTMKDKKDKTMDVIMGDTVKNVNIIAEKQNNILNELEELNGVLDGLENKIIDSNDKKDNCFGDKNIEINGQLKDGNDNKKDININVNNIFMRGTKRRNKHKFPPNRTHRSGAEFCVLVGVGYIMEE